MLGGSWVIGGAKSPPIQVITIVLLLIGPTYSYPLGSLGMMLLAWRVQKLI